MSLVSPLLALIYRARSRGILLRVQVNFPNPSLLRTAGLCTFLVSRGLLRRCHLVGRGRIFMGLLPSWTPGRLIRSSRGVTPSSDDQCDSIASTEHLIRALVNHFLFLENRNDSVV